MAKKLPPHVSKTKDGKTRVRYRKSQKYPIEYDKTFDTDEEAIAANEEYLGKIALRIYSKKTKADIKFADFCDYVYDWYRNKTKKVSQRTLKFYRTYMNILKLHFGNMNLRDISTIMIEQYLISESRRQKMGNKAKVGEQISSVTLHHEFVVLRMLFNRAFRWGFIEENPITEVEEPEFTEKEIIVPPYEELENIEAKIMKAPIKERVLFLLAFYTGMREEEVCGLHLDSFNREEGTVHVQRVVVQDDLTREFIEDRPKSKRSVRTLPLPSKFFDILDEYLSFRKLQVDYLKKKTNGSYKELPNLFLNKDGHFYRSGTLAHQWAKFRKKYNIDLTYHGLRHYFLTNQMNYNDDITARDVQELAGHANIKTTNRYIHPDREKIKKNATNIYNKFSREKLYCNGENTLTLPIEHVTTIILGDSKYSKTDELQITLEELSRESVDLFNISKVMDDCKNYLLANYPSLLRIEKYRYVKSNEEEILNKIAKEFGKEFQIEMSQNLDLEI